jgi:secreted trypsin-like serine protease
MAYVLDFRGNEVGQCSGTVVAPNLILTAGHCAEDMQTGVVNEASGYQVTTGNVDWAAPETEKQVSGVTRVIPCPCFDRHTLVGDAALLQLSTPTTAPAVTLASRPPSGTPRVLTRVDVISAWVRGWAQALASAPPASASMPAGLVAAPALPGVASSRSRPPCPGDLRWVV